MPSVLAIDVRRRSLLVHIQHAKMELSYLDGTKMPKFSVLFPQNGSRRN